MNELFNKDRVLLPTGIIIRDVFYPKKLLSSATLRIVLTTDCNFKCVYCYAEGEMDKEHRLITLKDLTQVLDAAKKIGIYNIKLTGGEPFCYPQLFQLIKYLNLNSFSFDITTNASLLSSEKINALNALGVSAINISLDSFDKTRFHRLTQTNCFDSVMNNLIFASQQYKGRIRINTIVFDDLDSLDDYYQIIDFCITNKVELRLIEPTSVTGAIITQNKSNFQHLISALRNKAVRVAKSDCGSIEYLFIADSCITALHSMCDNHFCNTCKKYLYLRLTSDLKLKPCLKRNDNEVEIDMSSDATIISSFLQAIDDWVNAKL